MSQRDIFLPKHAIVVAFTIQSIICNYSEIISIDIVLGLCLRVKQKNVPKKTLRASVSAMLSQARF